MTDCEDDFLSNLFGLVECNEQFAYMTALALSFIFIPICLYFTKWKIENSWGPKSGNQGYMMMTDEWFDEYTYEIVVDKKYLNKKLLKYLDTDPIKLEPWDPMGALAH